MSTTSLYVIAGLTGKGTQPTPPSGRAGAANEIPAAVRVDQSGGSKGRLVGGDAPPQDWWRLSGEVTHGDGSSDGISFRKCISSSQLSLTCCAKIKRRTQFCSLSIVLDYISHLWIHLLNPLKKKLHLEIDCLENSDKGVCLWDYTTIYILDEFKCCWMFSF